MRLHKSLTSALRFRLLGVAVLLLECGGTSIAAGQQAYRCLAPVPIDSVLRNAAVAILVNANRAGLRAAYGIPSGSASDVSMVQDDSTCSAAMAGFSAVSARVFTEPFVVARLGSSTPFYLMALRQTGLPNTKFLLDSHFTVLMSIGGSDGPPPPPGIVMSGPTDLRVTNASGGGVALAWSWTTPGVSSFTLQRASPTGYFADLGAPLPGTARSAVDTTANADVTYRYRVVARYGSVADGWSSNSVAVTPVSVVTLTRLSSGLIFRDSFDRLDGDLGGDWSAAAGPAFRIVGNVARPPAAPSGGGGDLARVTDAAMTPRAAMCLQTMTTSLTSLGSPMIWSQLTSAAAPSGWLALMGGEAGNSVLLYYVVNGNYQFFAQTPGGQFTQNVAQPFKLCTGPGTQRVWINGRLLIERTSTVLDGVAGTVGLRDGGTSADQESWDDVVVTSSNSLTVTGLPVGYKLRVGALTSAAATSSGMISFDLQGTKFPIAQIEILDTSGNVVKQIAPADGAWGGDEFTFTRS
jgi:hypothetical protein